MLNNRLEDVFKMDSMKILIKIEGIKIEEEIYADLELFSRVTQQRWDFWNDWRKHLNFQLF